jgi:transposase
MRYRTDLVGLQTMTKNRIHAIFHRHGVLQDFSDLFGTQGRAFLAELCRAGNGQLSGGALAALRGQVRLLGQVRKQLAEVTRRLRKELERTDLALRLDSIPGVGLVLAHTLIAEIGKIDRFSGHRQLASYALLAPRASDTGEADKGRAPLGRHLGKHGNRTLKWAFIEAAHGAVRWGGKWGRMWSRHTVGGKRDRNRGYIKVARELVKMVFAMWTNGTWYAATPPARPGSERAAGRRRRRKTRPGTGQPSQPMVAAR